MKARFQENFQRKFPTIYDETVSAAIKRIAFDSMLSMKQIAAEIGLGNSTAYHRVEDPNTMSIAEFCQLVRLAVSVGDMTLIDLMLPDSHTVTEIEDESIGDTLDECSTELVQDLGRAITSCKSGKMREAESAAREVITDSKQILRTVKKGSSR